MCIFVQYAAMTRDNEINRTGFSDPAPHLSKVAKRYFFDNFSKDQRDGLNLPAPDDFTAWKVRSEAELTARIPMNEALLSEFPATLKPDTLGHVRVTMITPNSIAPTDKRIVYVHGGGFVGGASHDALDSTLPLAHEIGLPIISIDYTLAPHARHDQITDEVVSVLAALYKARANPTDICIYGDSAGATIAGAAMLKAAARDVPLPAALVLWSPWTDLACTGDSYETLKDAEPFYGRKTFLKTAAQCYAGDTNVADPAVSILYADYSADFLPTLIQCGTREMLLSDSVRLHKQMLNQGATVTLDLYDGLWHVFQFKPIDGAEAQAARTRTVNFFRKHLGIA